MIPAVAAAGAVVAVALAHRAGHGLGTVLRSVGSQPDRRWDPLARRRAERRLVEALPDLVEGTARGLRAGLSLPVALAESGRRLGGTVARETAAIDRWMCRGLPLADALRLWESRHRDQPAVHLVVTAADVAARSGGRAAMALDGVAATLRERIELGRDARAQAAQARASATVMVALPAVFLAVTAALDPGILRVLFGTRLGGLCLIAGVGLEVLGALWMRRIVEGVVP